MTRVVIHPQVEGFLKGLSSEPRTRLIRSMKALPRGDTRSLEGRLDGYHRLRSGGYRIIYRDAVQQGVRTFDCLFAERRSFVYELFEQILAEEALG